MLHGQVAHVAIEGTLELDKIREYQIVRADGFLPVIAVNKAEFGRHVIKYKKIEIVRQGILTGKLDFQFRLVGSACRRGKQSQDH